MRYDAPMAARSPDSFGAHLSAALKSARKKQAWLAEQLSVDAASVSRWIGNQVKPPVEAVHRINELLDVDLTDAWTASSDDYELFVSAPIVGISPEAVAAHNQMVSEVVAAAAKHVNGVFWPGRSIRSLDDLAAPDLVTEFNLATLVKCRSLLYVQFAEVVRPTSALIELGFALGRRMSVTTITGRELRKPFMLDGFQGVASRVSFLAAAHIYLVEDVADAVRTVERNGRGLFGLR